MPKLTQDELYKRFHCPHCDKTLRTRQGLSGHIQWKHGTGKKSTKIDIDWISKQIDRMKKTWVEAMEWSPAAVQAREDILLRWILDVEAMCHVAEIKPNHEDFKNYIITSLAVLQVIENMQK